MLLYSYNALFSYTILANPELESHAPNTYQSRLAPSGSIPKYYSLNSNVIVTYGYDCENGVDESVKTMLIFPGFPVLDKFTAKSDLLQSIALSRSYKCTFYYKEACISCYNMRFASELIFV